jgi:hypothetical protein
MKKYNKPEFELLVLMPNDVLYASTDRNDGLIGSDNLVDNNNFN